MPTSKKPIGSPTKHSCDRRAVRAVAAVPIAKTLLQAAPSIMRMSSTPAFELEATAAVEDVLSEAGAPLDLPTRSEMERRLGHDLAHVRVHTGTKAAQANDDLEAHAFTVGHNVVFDRGRFEPRTNEGRRLLAHELVHVVQQGSMGQPGGHSSANRGGAMTVSREGRPPSYVRTVVPRTDLASAGPGTNPIYATTADAVDARLEQARLSPPQNEVIREYQRPLATLSRGGSAEHGFVTTARTDTIVTGGRSVDAERREFHILDAMEADIARARDDQELGRYLVAYISESALRFRSQSIGYLRGDVIIQPNLDPGGAIRLATARTAIARRSSRPTVPSPQPSVPSTPQTTGPSTPAPTVPEVSPSTPQTPRTPQTTQPSAPVSAPRGPTTPQTIQPDSPTPVASTAPPSPAPVPAPAIVGTTPSTVSTPQSITSGVPAAPANVRTVDVDLASACLPWNAAFDANWVTDAHRENFNTNWVQFSSRRRRPTNYGVFLQDLLSALNGQTMAAAIVVVAADGCMLAYARAYRTVGMSAHAEEQCLSALDRQLTRVPPTRLAGSRMHITANNEPCEPGQYAGTHDCRGRLMTLASDHGVRWGDVVVRPRPDFFDLAVQAVQSYRATPP